MSNSRRGLAAPTARTQARPSRLEASAGDDRGGDSPDCTAGAREPAARFLEGRQAGRARGTAATAPKVRRGAPKTSAIDRWGIGRT